ncbi:MAG: DUF1656 domain-containing protein [Planctomycetota bacterium]|jgi:uncharacterized membrane protein YeaQ/YmgE (transglycosylase-associated protein family)
MSAPVPSEISWGWIYLPPVIVVVALGAVGAWILTRILNRYGLSRFFWHPPLAMLALAALLSALIGLFVLAP